MESLDGDCLRKADAAEARSARQDFPGSALYDAVYCQFSPMTRLYNFTVTKEVLRELEHHIRTYVAANTDKRFKSLQILEVMI